MCGPFKELSFGYNRYFVTFVEEYGRMVWVYLIRAKCEVFSVFKKFKLMVKKNS